MLIMFEFVSRLKGHVANESSRIPVVTHLATVVPALRMAQLNLHHPD